MEKISIVVACYNVEKFISTCIESIKKQTYKNIEVFMVDDGSKDSTAKIIQKETKSDNRFIYLYKENGGLSDARNYGLSHATGKYICFIDSDDYIEPTYVEELYNALSKNHAKISICDIKRVYPKKNTINTMNNRTIDLCMKPAAWNKMYERDLFIKNNIKFPKNKWYEDLNTTSKLLFIVDGNYAIVHKALYNYVQHDASIMHTYDDRIFQIYDIMDDIIKYCKENHLYKKNSEKIEFMKIYHILVGTIYRASSHKDFSVQMIKDIYINVSKEHPKWYKNKYIKELPIFYRFYLQALKWNMYGLIYILLKIFGKKVHL